MSAAVGSTELGRRSFLRRAAGVGLVVAVGGTVAEVWKPGKAAAYPWSGNLQQGSSGAQVVELQIRVAGWAAGSASQTYVAIDGAFGPGTESAVRRFQTAYGLGSNGVVAASTQSVLNSLESADGSTAHFDFSEFTSHDGAGFGGGRVSTAQVQENVRRSMYKLEALRKKAGDRATTINSGFRSVAYNSTVPGSAPNSQHTYGIAADIAVSGLSTLSIYKIAETCGFSGLEAYTNSWQHCDSRIEHAYGAQAWWWESGVA